MRNVDVSPQTGLTHCFDLDQLRQENIQLRRLIVDLSKLVLTNVASQLPKTVQTVSLDPARAQRQR